MTYETEGHVEVKIALTPETLKRLMRAASQRKDVLLEDLILQIEESAACSEAFLDAAARPVEILEFDYETFVDRLKLARIPIEHKHERPDGSAYMHSHVGPQLPHRSYVGQHTKGLPIER